MPDVELQTPEIDDIDQQASPFRRRVALLVVGITLLGSIVAYLQTAASNNEDEAARDSHRLAITGLGQQIDTSAEFQFAYEVYTQAELLDRRRLISRGRQRSAVGTDAESAFRLGAERFQAVRDSLTGLSPLLENEEYSETADPLFPTRYDADVTVEPDLAQLRQEAKAEEADSYGGKADTYVAILTVLAVSLFLIGLSLTVVGRGRVLLLAPGVGLAAVCVLWTLVVAAGGVQKTPDPAIEAVGEGLRLIQRGDYEDAIEALDEAIDIRPDYATAYGYRADAHFVSGSSQETTFVSVTDPENLAAAIEDAEKAVELGADRDVGVVGSLGFYYFLQGDYDDAARLTNRALDFNDKLPTLWLNLGVIEAARGNDDRAEGYYDVGIDLLRDEPNEFVRGDIFAGGRTDLELLVLAEPELDEAAERFETQLTSAETELRLGDRGSSRGATIETVALEQDGAFMAVDYVAEGLEDGTPLAFIGYHRTERDGPFVQPSQMVDFRRFEAADEGATAFAFLSNGQCLPPGDYRVDVYAGGRKMAEIEGEVTPSVLGEISAETNDDLGLSMCVPTEWEVEADLETGFLQAVDPAEELGLVQVGVLAMGAEALAQGGDVLVAEQIDTAIDDLGGTPEPPQEAFVGGISGTVTEVDMGGGARASVGSAITDDGVVHVVITFGADQETFDAIKTQMVNTLFFTT